MNGRLPRTVLGNLSSKNLWVAKAKMRLTIVTSSGLRRLLAQAKMARIGAGDSSLDQPALPLNPVE
ncbi:hypothetical protein U2F10_21640 [Leptothoe sp. EHU-05/26/07-4]